MNNVEDGELSFGHTENEILDRKLPFGCVREESLVQMLSKLLDTHKPEIHE